MLDDRVAQLRQLLKARDIVTFCERDIEYHRELWNLAGDEYLSQLLEQIVVPLFAFFIMVNRDLCGSSKRSQSPPRSTRKSPTA